MSTERALPILQAARLEQRHRDAAIAAGEHGLNPREGRVLVADGDSERLKRHLEASGFEVLQIAGYGVQKNAQLTDLPVHASYKIAKRLYAKARGADGIFIACPRWPTITDVAVLEEEIGKPVITSSLACIWYAMKMIDVKEDVKGFGRLMASLGT